MKPCPSIDSISRRVHRNSEKVSILMTELGLSGDPEKALEDGLHRNLPSRIERLLHDHPRFEHRFLECLEGVGKVLADEARQVKVR